MTTKYAMNYTIDPNTANNSFSAMWKLTRIMKAAGWTYKASGDGHIKDTSGTAANDRWGGNVDPTTDVYPSTTLSNLSSGLSAALGTIYVVSTSGFPSSGTFNLYGNSGSVNTNITYTGTTATTFTGCTGGSGTMGTGYAVTLLDPYFAWWCAEGPSTVKIGIGAASSGTFLHGEQISQATSGATGELVGYVINAAANSGWMVVLPRTGTFDGTHVITGATSGATVTATSYNLIRRQMVFAKDSSVNAGWIFYEAVMDTEIAGSSNTALFSDLAANAANCTATTCPGNSSSSNNLFPAYGIACLGTSQNSGGSAYLFQTPTKFGKAQIAATNATPGSGVSADGSFYCAVAGTDGTSSTPDSYRTFGLMRLDDTEPGDNDPFVFLTGGTSEAATSSTGRTQGTTLGGYPIWSNYGSATYTNTPAKGYCARTVQTIGTGIDVYSGFTLGLAQAWNGSQGAAQSICTFINGQLIGPFVKIKNHPDAYTVSNRPIELFSVIGPASGLTMRKGVCRWLGAVPNGATNDTINKQWLVIFTSTPNSIIGNNPNPAIVIGPIDGTTTPVIS
jgi:hypothetical protein